MTKGDPAERGVTLRDVARRANVSVASASRVMNHRAQVASELHERVLAAASELGYFPHGAARAPASQRTRTVGAIASTLENPSFAVMVEALQQPLGVKGFTLLHASSHYDRDSRTAAYKLAGYLLNLGHTEFGVIAGVTQNNGRAGGPRWPSAASRCPGDGSSSGRTRWWRDSTRCVRRWPTPSSHPAQVICGNDMLALGALNEAARLGIDVPWELSITGFGDMEFAQELNPPLTTIHVPAEEMGRRAGELILEAIEKTLGPIQIEIPVNLIVRKTTGPPPREFVSPSFDQRESTIHPG